METLNLTVTNPTTASSVYDVRPIRSEPDETPFDSETTVRTGLIGLGKAGCRFVERFRSCYHGDGISIEPIDTSSGPKDEADLVFVVGTHQALTAQPIDIDCSNRAVVVACDLDSPPGDAAFGDSNFDVFDSVIALSDTGGQVDDEDQADPVILAIIGTVLLPQIIGVDFSDVRRVLERGTRPMRSVSIMASPSGTPEPLFDDMARKLRESGAPNQANATLAIAVDKTNFSIGEFQSLTEQVSDLLEGRENDEALVSLIDAESHQSWPAGVVVVWGEKSLGSGLET